MHTNVPRFFIPARENFVKEDAPRRGGGGKHHEDSFPRGSSPQQEDDVDEKGIITTPEGAGEASDSFLPCEKAIYFVGHSLGLQPRKTRELVNKELDKWAAVGVNGHFSGDHPWAPIDEFATPGSARLVGALEKEVCIMNTLTVGAGR